MFRNVKYFIAKRKLKKINIKSLVEESNYLQSKCMNELRKNEKTGFAYWYHCPPLKDEEKHFYND